MFYQGIGAVFAVPVAIHFPEGGHHMRRLISITLAMAALFAVSAGAWADGGLDADPGRYGPAISADSPVLATPGIEIEPLGDVDAGEEAVADAEEAAAEAEETELEALAADIKFYIHNLWILIAAFLVFIMHLGFATLESGLCQSKNTVNILFKNTLVPTLGLVLYALWGFNLMYPDFAEDSLGILAFGGFGIPGFTDDPEIAGRGYYDSYPVWTDFLFQGMFAATAMTIVSGCVAERVKLSAFLIFTLFYVGFVYPFVGSWHWGEGWLERLGFADFAGSTLVHSVGGWGGLAGILVIGARRGKYGPNGEVRAILPSNMTLAAIGVFILWFGWFGFNGGSVLSANPAEIAYVCVTTSLAAAMGGITAAMTSWFFGKKPDLSMALNGILAGLVGITANADIASLPGAMIIGLICGLVVYFAVLFFDKLRIDDPVGALSVHLVCGILGTLFCGIPFLMMDGAAAAFHIQILGVLAYGVVCFPAALIFWLVLKSVMGVRVSEEEEVEGLDMGEHGVPAYAISSETH